MKKSTIEHFENLYVNPIKDVLEFIESPETLTLRISLKHPLKGAIVHCDYTCTKNEGHGVTIQKVLEGRRYVAQKDTLVEFFLYMKNLIARQV